MLSIVSRALVRSLRTNTHKINPTLLFKTKSYTPRYCFTSSSNSAQTVILEEVEAKVYQVLKSAAKCDQSKLSRSATFEELGFDSLDSVELVVAME